LLSLFIPLKSTVNSDLLINDVVVSEILSIYGTKYFLLLQYNSWFTDTFLLQ